MFSYLIIMFFVYQLSLSRKQLCS